MNNLTTQLEMLLIPRKAIVIYQSTGTDGENVYVESYDMNTSGYPVNAHPLDVEEATELAECLNSSPALQSGYLKSKGLLPTNIVYINPSDRDKYVIWYTRPQKVQLLFTGELAIPCAAAWVPPLLWKAGKEELYIYALRDSKRPTLRTPIYRAPFFNIHSDGKVCMGTVDIDIDRRTTLEEFITQWQGYFFNSHFSHLIGGSSPVAVNIEELWNKLIHSGKKFPVSVLKPTGLTCKNLLS